MAAADASAKQLVSQVRGHVDYWLGVLFWVAVIAVKACFIAIVAKLAGHPIPYVPTIPELTLVYLAGVVYLISKA